MIFMLSALIVMVPQLSYAASNTPMGNVLCTVVAWAGGNAGRGLSTIGITIFGLGALFGKISWGLAIMAGLEIAIIHSAAAIVNNMGANVSGITGLGGAAATTTC
jgi:type IV secretory pathway VirB2 component (pilin)